MKKQNLISGLIILSALIVSSFIYESNEKNNVLDEVTIGEQTWMSKNLNVATFRNGDSIPVVETDEEWKEYGELGKPACCYYENNPENGEKYGMFYNWYAVNDPRGLAPEGWRVPSEEDWIELVDFLGGISVAGNKMKTTDSWKELDGKDSNGTNESGFSAIPVGGRGYRGFSGFGKSADWWSSDETGDRYSPVYSATYRGSKVERFGTNKKLGFSVRCLKEVKNQEQGAINPKHEQWDFCTCIKKSDSLNTALMSADDNEFKILMERSEIIDKKCKDALLIKSKTDNIEEQRKKIKDCLEE